MQIITTRPTKPPRICIYGTGGIGKSTFGSLCPKPVFIQTEDGLEALSVQAFPKCEWYKDIHDCLDFLLAEEHDRRTLVIDSLDWAEKLIFNDVCAETGKRDIADIGFGRGYVMAENRWKETLDKLDQLNRKGMLIVLIAHSHITRFEDPERDGYDRYGLDLQKKSAGLITEWVDILGYVGYRTVVKSKESGFGSTVTKGLGTGERVLYLEERPAFVAKNRYGLPESIEFSWKALATELKSRREVKNEETKEGAKTNE